jgi:acyl dehydratase
MKYFEDFPQGSVYTSGSYAVTADNIIDFARQFDPQPFHLDEDVANASLLGGLAASGWQTAVISMRLHCDSWLKDSAGLGSPGITEMKWLKPVLKGYAVRQIVRIVNARLSLSRPGMGILEHETEMLNQHDDVVMTTRAVTLVASRGAPAGLSVYDPAALARAPKWIKPDNVLSSPAETSSSEGILTGWLQDMTIGLTVDLGSHVFREGDIIRFAAKWDPQFFHLDAEAARTGPFGALTASGWHTGATGMSRHVATRQAYLAEGKRRGLPEAPRGPSPGFRDMKWLEPVFAGDEIHYFMTTEGWRATSRKGWGVMFTKFEGVNQHGRKVYEYVSTGMWPMRPE